MNDSKDALEKATEYVKTGRLTEAKNALMQYLRGNPSSEQAWLLMSYTVSEPAQQRDCLERVLRINPDNHVARSKLALLINGPAVSKPARPEPPALPTSPPTSNLSKPPLVAEDPPSFFKPDRPKDRFPEDPSEPEDATGVQGRLLRLRNRSQSSAIPIQAMQPEPSVQKEIPAIPESSEEEAKEPFQMTSEETPSGRRWLPLIGIGIAAIIIVIIVIIIAKGNVSLPWMAAEPTFTPTNTPIQVISLPPAWTKTPTLTPSITPTETVIPTDTPTPTWTPIVSHTPTKPK
jgi:hypothetical protein